MLALAFSMAGLQPATSQAENITRLAAPISTSQSSWTKIDPLVTDWQDSSDFYGCSTVFPQHDYHYTGVTFQQTHSDCFKDQIQTRQDQVINSKTGEVRPSGSPYTAQRTLSGLSYTTSEAGTSTTYSVIMNAGRATNSSTFVGMYARVDTGINVGSVVKTPDGDRVLIYFARSGGINSNTECFVRLGITRNSGWEPSKTATATAIAFGSKANVLTFFDASGKPASTYRFPTGSNVDGGHYRTTTANCADMVAFYNNLGHFTKATLTP